MLLACILLSVVIHGGGKSCCCIQRSKQNNEIEAKLNDNTLPVALDVSKSTLVITSSKNWKTYNDLEKKALLAFHLALKYEIEEQNYEKARHYYLRAIEYDDSLRNAHYNLGLILLEYFQDYESFVKHMILALPNCDNVNSAIIFMKAKPIFRNLQSARNYYQQVLIQKPSDLVARFALIMVLDEDGINEDIVPKDDNVRHCKIILSYAPDHFLAHIIIAGIYEAIAKTDDAMEHWKLAMQYHPKVVALRIEFALFLERMKRYKEAEENFMFVIQSHPNVIVHVELGKLLEEKCDLIRSYDQYQIARACKRTEVFPLPRNKFDDYHAQAINNIMRLGNSPDFKKQRAQLKKRLFIWNCKSLATKLHLRIQM